MIEYMPEVTLFVAIVLQTIAYAYWMGRLAQTVNDLKKDFDVLKTDVVYRDTHQAQCENVQTKIQSLAQRLVRLEQGLQN
jgi:hypothetical protein